MRWALVYRVQNVDAVEMKQWNSLSWNKAPQCAVSASTLPMAWCYGAQYMLNRPIYNKYLKNLKWIPWISLFTAFTLFTRYRLRFLTFSSTSPTPILAGCYGACLISTKNQARNVFSFSSSSSFCFPVLAHMLPNYMDRKDNRNSIQFNEYSLVKIKRFK